jgi:Mn2+/Fe2+ NRAMP family transporter
MKILATVVLAAVVSVTAATTHAATRSPGIARLTAAQRHAVRAAGEWHSGCPVWKSQ